MSDRFWVWLLCLASLLWLLIVLARCDFDGQDAFSQPNPPGYAVPAPTVTLGGDAVRD